MKVKWKWKSLSHVHLFANPWTIQATEFSRPEYWSGKPIPSPGDLPTQGSNLGLLHCRWVLYQLSYQGIPESIFFFKIYYNWRLITLQYCDGFCHTFAWVYMCTCVPHPDSPCHLPSTSLPIPSLRVIPVHQPWEPCLTHQTWTGDLFHIWLHTWFNAILSNHPTLTFSQKSVLYIWCLRVYMSVCMCVCLTQCLLNNLRLHVISLL